LGRFFATFLFFFMAWLLLRRRHLRLDAIDRLQVVFA